MIVVDLNTKLPAQYVASPRVEFRTSSLTESAGEDEFEVLIHDTEGRRSVAAIEIVSPANKGNPEARRAFVRKCLMLLRRGVSVALVDLVTTYRSNLYADLLAEIGPSDPTLLPTAPFLYATAVRWQLQETSRRIETWTHKLAVGEALPTLPLWLAADLAVPLDLEATYEETCRALRIA